MRIRAEIETIRGGGFAVRTYAGTEGDEVYMGVSFCTRWRVVDGMIECHDRGCLSALIYADAIVEE